MSRLSALLVGTTIVLVQPQIAFALSAREVAKIAKEITVTIDGCSSGSGVIFQRQHNTYQVLTANHVVNSNQEFCRVITPDGVRHSPNTANIKPIEGVDLAVMQFDSSNSYRVGKLGNSSEVDIGTTVYVAGVAASTDEVPRTLRVSPGQIIGMPPQAPEGYTLIYNNTTRGGMSGGPILDASGAIVGIHGKGNPSGGIKENYGIPIKGIPIERYLQVQATERTGGERAAARSASCGVRMWVLLAPLFVVLGYIPIVGIASWLFNSTAIEDASVLSLVIIFPIAVIAAWNESMTYNRKKANCTAHAMETLTYKGHSREEKKIKGKFSYDIIGIPAIGYLARPSSGLNSERGVSIMVEREE